MRFNINDYETVEQRIRKFYEAWPDGRIVTKMVDYYDGSDQKTWVFKAFVYLTAGDQANKLPKATGYASEREGGPQTEWKAELAETSAIGRALANMNLSGNKRASREEMQKVQRAENRDWLQESTKLTTKEALRVLWADAKAANAPEMVLKQIKERANGLDDTSSLSGGIAGSVSGLFEAEAEGGSGWSADPKPKAGRGK